MNYLVFTRYTYYPEGGWYDHDSNHESLEDAVARADKYAAKGRTHSAHVVSVRSLEIVYDTRYEEEE
jgi:hypothetical protein